MKKFIFIFLFLLISNFVFAISEKPKNKVLENNKTQNLRLDAIEKKSVLSEDKLKNIDDKLIDHENRIDSLECRFVSKRKKI